MTTRYPAKFSGPAQDIVPVTPSDSIDLDFPAVSFYAEVGGTISCETGRRNTRSITVVANQMYPLIVRQFNATGTTATGIQAFTVDG